MITTRLPICWGVSTFDVLSGTGGGSQITASWFTDEQNGWLATSDGSFLISSDGGDTWRNLSVAAFDPSERIASVRVAKRIDGSFYGWLATNKGRVLHTRDGHVWNANSSLDRYVSSIQLFNEQSAMVRGQRGLWRTDDTGKTWKQIRAELTGWEHVHYEFSHFRDILHGVAIFRGQQGWRVEITNDGGKSWLVEDRAFKYESNVFLSTIHAEEQVHVYWGGELLYRSGRPLKQKAAEQLLSRKASHPNLAHLRRTIQRLSQKTVFVKEPTWWQWSGFESLQKSQDGGKTWRRKFLTAGFKNIFFVDMSCGWVVGFGGRVSRTCDGGDNWIHTFLPTDADFRGIYFVDAQTGWIGGGTRTPNCVWRTDDGGVTWKLAAEIANGRRIEHGIQENVKGLVFRNRKEGWAATHGSTLKASDDWRDNASEPLEYGRVLHTVDGGLTWKQVYYGSPLYGIARRNNVLVACGFGIVRTDDGKTWDNIRAPLLFAIAFRDDDYVAAGGEQSSYFFSRNRGGQWKSVAHQPRAHLDSIAFASEKVGWMGGSFGSDDHQGLFATSDGGKTWQVCKVAGVHPTGGAQYWRGLSAVDQNHAWACCEMSIARVRTR
jgi:photosystem II stability/assembly factor-like uncharacterized protein